MITLRSYNKRMGKFGSPKIKRSRRKFAIGGETSMWDPTYRDSSAESVGGTSLQNLQTMDDSKLRKGYQEGGTVMPEAPEGLKWAMPNDPNTLPPTHVGEVKWLPREQQPWDATDYIKMGVGALTGQSIPRALGLGVNAMRTVANRGAYADAATRAARSAAGTPIKPIRPPSQATQDAAHAGKAIGDSANFALKEHARMKWAELHPSDQPRLPREAMPEVPVERVQTKKERKGLRSGYQTGGQVVRGRILDEEGNPVEPEPLVGPVQPEKTEGSGLVGGLDPLSKAISETKYVEPPARSSAERMGEAVKKEMNARARAANQAEPFTVIKPEGTPDLGTLGQAVYTGPPPKPGYVSDEEAAAGGRNKLLDEFGLRAGTTRQTSLPGGVTKYKDASGKTLYANTTDTSNRISTYESGPTAKANADRLTGAIQARLASGAPEDLEMARKLAVTPEHRALIAEQDNLRGLRNRVALGDPSAAFELQNRAEQGKIAAQSKAAMLQELFKHQLSSQITPYQQADLGLRAQQQAQTEARATRTENFAQNNAMIANQFGDTPEGKAAQVRFNQRLADTLPHLKGDIAQLKPEEQNLLFGMSKVLDAYEAKNAPGWIRSLFGAKPPRYDQLLDAMRGAKIEAGNIFGGRLVTNYGTLKEGDVDPGTWRTITRMVHDAQQNAPNLMKK